MSSDEELYEIAARRIDQRNRRWMIWAFNLAFLVALLAIVVLVGETEYAKFATAAFLGWGGVFAAHTIIAGFAEARQGEIDSEVTKLRAAREAAREMYDKPKRLELAEDGELIEPDEDDEIRQERLRRN
jgi:hypothetical protein